MKIPEKHHKAFDAYNEDCKRHDMPWKYWQSKDPHGEWDHCYGPPQWCPGREYRRKPATVTICGVELPEPVREPLEDGDRYCVVGLADVSLLRCEWCGDSIDKERLHQGRIHRSAEDARAWREFLVGLMSGRIGTQTAREGKTSRNA